MSVDTDLSNIDITKLNPAVLRQILAQAKEIETAEREARKVLREKGREFCSTLVGFLQDPSTELPEGPVGNAGAMGWSLGGKDIDVEQSDGSTRKARVTLQVRWEDTIPAEDS